MGYVLEDPVKEEDKFKCQGLEGTCNSTSFHLSSRVDGTRYTCDVCGHWSVIEDPNYEG